MSENLLTWLVVIVAVMTCMAASLLVFATISFAKEFKLRRAEEARMQAEKNDIIAALDASESGIDQTSTEQQNPQEQPNQPVFANSAHSTYKQEPYEQQPFGQEVDQPQQAQHTQQRNYIINQTGEIRPYIAHLPDNEKN